jgi:prohibitin 2
MKFLVEVALENKKSTIIKAQGEAESFKKFGQTNAINTTFLELRKIETTKIISKIIRKIK